MCERARDINRELGTLVILKVEPKSFISVAGECIIKKKAAFHEDPNIFFY